MRFWTFVFSIIFFLCASSWAYASVVITEIMYDLSGSDTGREWVEIQNNGSATDLTGWKFFENGVNHTLVLSQGNISLPQNGFAVIADSAEKFLLDWPGFSGTLLDSSFSLSNTGEALALRDSGLTNIDNVTYSSDLGANGDGNSLQKINDKWVSVVPTPGLGGSGLVNETNTVEPQFDGGAVVSGSIQEPKPSPFKAFAGNDRSAVAGAEVYFEGRADGISEDLISKARFLWNFGDGTTEEGKNVKHVFLYPGNYIINLNVSFGAYSDSDSVKISVFSAGIFVSEIKPGPSDGGFIEIKNDSTKISDVSGFAVQVNDSKIFSFPKDTKLSANSFLVLNAFTLGIEIPDKGEIKILYPNGKILFSSKYESGNLVENESISFDGDPPAGPDGTVGAGGWIRTKMTPGTKNDVLQNKLSTKIEPKKVVEQKKFIKQNDESLASVVLPSNAKTTNASLWPEIKWLIFGLGGGVLVGVIYLLLKARFLTKTEQPSS